MNGEKRYDLAGLRSAALVALLFGAVGSIGLLRHAKEHPPPLLLAGFVIWILAPFGLLGVANLRSIAWPVSVRTVLSITTLLVTIASVAIYVDDNIKHRTAHPAFVWVLVPPAAIIISAIAVGTAAWQARNRNSKQP